MNIPVSFKDSTSEGFFPFFARAVALYLEEITLIPSKHLMVPAIDQSRDVTLAKNKNNTNRPSVGEECQALSPLCLRDATAGPYFNSSYVNSYNRRP